MKIKKTVDGLFMTKVTRVLQEKTYVMELNEEEIIKDYGSVEEFKFKFSESEFDFDKILKSKYHVVSTSIPGQEVNEEWFDEQIGDFTYYSDNEYVTDQNVLKLNYDLYFKGSFWNDIKENKE